MIREKCGKRDVLVDSLGTRSYTEAVLAAALGVAAKDLGRLTAAGYLPLPQIKFGSKKVWDERPWPPPSREQSGRRLGTVSLGRSDVDRDRSDAIPYPALDRGGRGKIRP